MGAGGVSEEGGGEGTILGYDLETDLGGYNQRNFRKKSN